MNSTVSKLITPKSIKPSASKDHAGKVTRAKSSADESAVADRMVQSVVVGLKTFENRGTFSKVY
jgi:hypothetical protein